MCDRQSLSRELGKFAPVGTNSKKGVPMTYKIIKCLLISLMVFVCVFSLFEKDNLGISGILFSLCAASLWLLGEVTDIGYVSVNVLLFCYLMPLVFVFLLFKIFSQNSEIKNLKEHINKTKTLSDVKGD
jgi:hypothetical protein